MKSLEGTERTVGGMSEPRESFIVYRSFYEAIRELPEQNALHLYQAIFAFGLDGEEIELKGIEKTIFTLIRPQLVANWRKYENGKREKQSKQTEDADEDGEQKSKPEAKAKQTRSKTETNGNVNQHGNVGMKKGKGNKKDTVSHNVTNNDSLTATDSFTGTDNALASFYSKEGKAFHITKNDLDTFPIIYPGADVLAMLKEVERLHAYAVPEHYSKQDVLESLKKRVSEMQETYIKNERKKQSSEKMVLPENFDYDDTLLPYN